MTVYIEQKYRHNCIKNKEAIEVHLSFFKKVADQVSI